MFDEKVDSEGVGEHTAIILLQDVNFGSSFPELTEKIYRKAFRNDMAEMDTWTRTFAHGLNIPKGLAPMSLEEGGEEVLQMVAAYTSKYYPELFGALDLRGYVEEGG